MSDDVIFLDGGETGINITTLNPNTVYSIMVEARTAQGIPMSVGSVQLTTTPSGKNVITFCN